MHAPSMQVKCSVSSCTHYNDNYCMANELQVNNINGAMAHNSGETQCETFAPKA